MTIRYPQSVTLQTATNPGCPEYVRCKQICLASTRQMVPGRRQQMRYCATDDYDNCPLYLCKALRSSRSHGFDRDTLIDSGK